MPITLTAYTATAKNPLLRRSPLLLLRRAQTRCQGGKPQLRILRRGFRRHLLNPRQQHPTSDMTNPTLGLARL